MKSATKRLVASIAAVALGGCASGGGGGGGSSSDTGSTGTPVSLEQLLVCIMSIGLACPVARQGTKTNETQSQCGTLYGRPVQCVPTQRAAIDAAMKDAEDPSPLQNYGATSSSAASASTPASGYVRLDMYYEPNTTGTIRRTEFLPEEWSARAGTPVASDPAAAPGDPKALNPFSHQPGNAGVDSTGLGFQYQSFGVWNRHIGYNGEIMAWSHGRTTPASAVPASGNARFTGKLVGLYVSPAGSGAKAAADVVVDANFSARSLGFASTNTAVQGNAAPQLNLTGTLTYAPGKSNFSGSLRSAGGTLSGPSKGQFYGPRAEEVGGAFTLRAPSGPETFAGAYGAKR
jgi:hypothetical protein